MTNREPNPYLKTKVMTATPLELRIMLFDGAIKFLEQGRAAIEAERHEDTYNGIKRCQDIVLELLNTLEHDRAPELCDKLSALYTFMFTRLVEALTERSVEKADEVLGLLQYERETWIMLRDKLANENASGAAAATDVANDLSATSPGASTPDVSGIVGGRVSAVG